MRLERKKLKKTLDSAFRAKIIHETDFFRVIDTPDGDKIITMMVDGEGSIYRIVFTKKDMERVIGIKTTEKEVKSFPRDCSSSSVH